jgi:hypothetical protein
MKEKTISTVLAIVALSLGTIARVSAQPFVLGGTGDVADQLVVQTSGGPVTLDTSMGEINSDHGFNQGWWSGSEGNSLGNDNVFTGSDSGDSLNDFNAFSLSSLNGATVLSATLVLVEGNDGGTAPFNLSFWDVTTPLATLVNIDGTSSAIYNDLGSGIEYGSLAYAGGALTINVPLDAAALAAINGGGTGGYFAVGGTLTPSSSSVPDAGTTLGLFGMSVSCLLALRRKK